MNDRFTAEKRKTHQEKLASAGCGIICQTDQDGAPWALFTLAVSSLQNLKYAGNELAFAPLTHPEPTAAAGQ